MMVYVFPRLVSVVIDRRLEQAMLQKHDVSPEALIWLSARLPLPVGWRFWGMMLNPDADNYVALIEHDSFPRTIDGQVIPQWPVFNVKALSHLTLCGDTRLHA